MTTLLEPAAAWEYFANKGSATGWHDLGTINEAGFKSVLAIATSELIELRAKCGTTESARSAALAGKNSPSYALQRVLDGTRAPSGLVELQKITSAAAEVKELRRRQPRAITNSAKTVPASAVIAEGRQILNVASQAKQTSAQLRTYKAPAPAVATITMTADQFRAATAKPSMHRSEFNKLTPKEQGEWFRQGGKLHS